jgi:signal transduction histidine kinase
MRNAGTRLGRIAASRRTDRVLAGALALGALAYQAIERALDRGDWTIPVFAVLACGSIAARRRWPFAAAVATGVGLALPGLLNQANSLSGPLNVLLVAPVLVAYTLGTGAGFGAGLAGVVLLALALQTGSAAFNPFFEMVTLGPWLAGRAMLSRRRLAQQIETRNRELEAERALFAFESVRYERARIARELHDIVAHCVSLIVVQASAGQRLAAADPVQAGEALDAICDAAAEADAELALLADHLVGGGGRAGGRDLEAIAELARRTAATGLEVRYRRSGDLQLHPDASDAAYRVVQESLTNAIKHAPGAAIDITIRDTDEHVEVEVTSAATGGPASGLEHIGAGRGLAGMGERIAACGGTLTAGPTPTGGWRVRARLAGLAPATLGS